MCDSIKNKSDSVDISGQIELRYTFGTIIGICNVSSIILCFLIIYCFYIRFVEYKKSSYSAIAFFMVLTDLFYQIAIVTSLVPASFITNIKAFQEFETTYFVMISKNLHLLVIYFVNQIILFMGIQRMSIIYNKSNCLTSPIGSLIICTVFLLLDTVIIILRRLTSFLRWINYAGLFIDICSSKEDYGVIHQIADSIFYISFITPIIIFVLLLITYFRLKKDKNLIHIEERNEALALQNINNRLANQNVAFPITTSKNMKNLLKKYKINSERNFLFQQMILCFTVSMGMLTTYIQFYSMIYERIDNIYYGIFRGIFQQITFSSLSVCLVIFNKPIRDDIYELLYKIFNCN
uniref:G_PROTEIN_RECEP_F1_2 domain-containing protein n=1 Tax=Parastrongyloides trichosuri TaxID=131310 RepID=A0A0N4ZW43_PARTI